MKKILVLILASLFVSSLFITQGIRATTDQDNQSGMGFTDEIVNTSPLIYPPLQYSQGVAILALFDKNGSARIAAKITVDSDDKQELQDFSLFLPGKNVKLIRAVHEKWAVDKKCDYPYPKPLPLMEQQAGTSAALPEGTPLERQYCPQEYVSTFTTLTPIVENQPDGLLATIKAEPVLADKNQESILLLYEMPKLAGRFLTNYHFKLFTPQIPVYASTVQAGLLTKDGLFLKDASYYGGGYQVNFRALEKAKSLQNEVNSELSQFSSDILYQGMVRKGDSDFSSNTSLEIKGVYGKKVILLFLNELFAGVAVLIVLIAGIYFLVRFISKRSPNLKPVFMMIVIALAVCLVVTILTVLAVLYISRHPVFINLLPSKIS